jgi:hypothetical protein
MEIRSGRPVTISRSETLEFCSRINGIDYVLYVHTPGRYHEDTERHALVVTLDADYQFAIAANHLDHLAERGQLPASVLVSVAYADADQGAERYRLNRTRDYTPVFWPEGGYGAEYQAVSGGGESFRRVLSEEVLPLIEARYRIDAENKLFVGHSYGGLFGAWMLATHPELFDRYLLVSPSCWYADEWLLREMESASPPALGRATRVYVAVGENEEQPSNGRPMVSQSTRFTELLRRRSDPNLDLAFRIFSDETHASIFPAAFSSGVRRLFST